MAKNSVRDFDATAANNTDIQSVDIAENCAPSGINNAIRELMADVKDVSTGTIALESPQADSLTVTGDLTVDTNTLFVDSTNNNVYVGKTSSDIGTAGIELQGGNDRIFVTRSGDSAMYLNRTTSDGSVLEILKDGTTVGSLGIDSGGFYVDGEANHTGLRFKGGAVTPRLNGAQADNTVGLGNASERFSNLYLGGSVYLGGTASANALDDYEEGTCTFTTNHSGGLTQNSASRYTKIGRLVMINFDITFGADASTGACSITNLPFNGNSYGSVVINWNNYGEVTNGHQFGTSFQIMNPLDGNVGLTRANVSGKRFIGTVIYDEA